MSIIADSIGTCNRMKGNMRESIARKQTAYFHVPRAGASHSRLALKCAVLAIAYFAGSQLGLLFKSGGNPISMLWPPNALVLAALLLTRRREWPLLCAAVLPIHLWTQLSRGVSIETSAGWYLTNVAEALVGALCVRSFCKRQNVFDTFRGTVIYIAFGVFLAPFVTSFFDASVVVSTVSQHDFQSVWNDRFFSNMLSNLTFTPPAVAVMSSWRQGRLRWGKGAESALVALLIYAVVTVVFRSHIVHSQPATLYLLLPILLWTAVRFGSAGASASLLLVALICLWDASQSRGPFANEVRALQMFLAILIIPLLCLGAVLEERRAVENTLRSSQRLLDIISESAARFVNLNWENVDAEVYASMRRMLTFMNSDRVSVYEAQSDGRLQLRCSARAEGVKPPPDYAQVEAMGWSMSQLNEGKVALISDARELAADSAERRRMDLLGVRSIAVVPILSDRSLKGILSITYLHDSFAWSADNVPLFRVFGEILFDALERKRAMQGLEESETRFRHIADETPMLVWMSQQDSLLTYVNKSWRQFTGLSAQDIQGRGWLRAVHRDDVDRMLSTFEHAHAATRQFRIEYRLRRVDGEYRWVLDTGVPRFEKDGRFLGFVGSAVDITDLKHAEQILSNFSGKLITAQENERHRIARDLHDDIGQRVALMAIELEKAQDSSADSQKIATDVLSKTKELAVSLRQISHNLHSTGLDILPLPVALKALCSSYRNEKALNAVFSESNVPESIPQEIKLCFFRIAQESLQNAAKHSGARSVLVSLFAQDAVLQMIVADDGIGFDAAQKSAVGMGLSSMRERIKALGGTLTIHSARGEGTRIKALLRLQTSFQSEERAA